jgi:hypothetical protein
MDEPAPPSRADRARRGGVVGAALALLFVLGIGANLTGVLDAPLPWLTAIGAAGLSPPLCCIAGSCHRIHRSC